MTIDPISTPEQAFQKPGGRRAVEHCPNELDAEPMSGEIDSASGHFDSEERMPAPWYAHGTGHRQRL
jgi:hypothetical protein